MLGLNWLVRLNYQELDNHFQSTNFQISHWLIPRVRLVLVKIEPGAYYLKVYSDGSEKFSNSNEFNFQIHFEPEEQIIGLYVFSKNRGWYLMSENVYEIKTTTDLIVKMYNTRKNMMDEIYATHQSK